MFLLSILVPGGLRGVPGGSQGRAQASQGRPGGSQGRARSSQERPRGSQGRVGSVSAFRASLDEWLVSLTYYIYAK